MAPAPFHTPADTPIWRNLSFQLMWLSVAASGFGDRVVNLAALTLMGSTGAQIEGTSVNAGLTFFFFLPYLILGIPAGWLADKLPRKWIMLACDESRALVLLAAFMLVPATGVAAQIPEDHFWKIYGIIFSVGVFAAIFNPARNATIPQLVPLGQLQAANALVLGIAVIASLIGFGVGRFMFDPQEAGSVRFGLGVGCLFFAVSGTFFAFLRVRSRSGAGLTAAQRRARPPARAMRYVLGHRRVLVLIGLNMLVWGMAFIVYNAAMGLCKQQYGFVDPKVRFDRYTDMALTIGLGMLSGAGWVAWMNTRRESGAVAMGSLLAAALCMGGLAFSESYALGLVLAFGVGFFGNTTIIGITTLLQIITPNFLRGRVMGLNTLANTTSNVAVNYAIWQLPDADTAIITILKCMAPVAGAISLWGLWLSLTRGPMVSRLGNVFWRLARLYGLIWHGLRWVGRHHIPREGPVILAANHTTGLDPILLQAACPRLVRWVMLERFRFRIFTPLWTVIDPICLARDGGDLPRVRAVVQALKNGDLVGLFPEGRLQREHRDLQPFQAGIGLVAKRSDATVVPIWIAGTPRTRHMLWHFARPSHSTVAFGRPYRPDPKSSHTEVLEDLSRRMVELRERLEG